MAVRGKHNFCDRVSCLVEVPPETEVPRFPYRYRVCITTYVREVCTVGTEGKAKVFRVRKFIVNVFDWLGFLLDVEYYNLCVFVENAHKLC